MEIVTVLRSIFIVMASTIAIADILPGVQSRFIIYGPRSSSVDVKKEKSSNGYLGDLVDAVSNIRVPHGWFYHFYILSLSLSVFWAFQLASHGPAITLIAEHNSTVAGHSMTFRQVLLVWSMMTAQGIRRLYETLKFSSPSTSRMWIAHWAAGLVFYACMSVAVWIEGSSAIFSTTISFWPFRVPPPSLKSFIAIPIFLSASGIQHDCHTYLASLKKYSLPDHPIFQLLICPHYFAECLVYLSLAIAAAPPGSLVNGTIACAMVFVMVNLGVTAKNTRQWYAQKFGADKIKGRWNMIPFIW